MTELYQLRVVLRDVSPLVWRRLLISNETSLAQLHEILQLAFRWSGEHLHVFHIHGRDYGVSQGGGIAFSEDARQVRLSQFRPHDGERFRYEYDFTAGWALDVRLEWALPMDAKRNLAVCTGGSRAAPPEGCGGAMDYLERMDSHRRDMPIEDFVLMTDAMQRLLGSGGADQHSVRLSLDQQPNGNEIGIDNGNHRIGAALIRGDPFVDALVYFFDPRDVHRLLPDAVEL